VPAISAAGSPARQEKKIPAHQQPRKAPLEHSSKHPRKGRLLNVILGLRQFKKELTIIMALYI
jgi:hypothetical protein